MKATLNQADLELLKEIFPTKDDLRRELKNTERRLVKKIDTMDKFLDREHMKLAREVGDIKKFVGYNSSTI